MKNKMVTGLLVGLVLVGGGASTVQADQPRGGSQRHGAYSAGTRGSSGSHHGFRGGELIAGMVIGSVLNGIFSPPAHVVYSQTTCSPTAVYVRRTYTACSPQPVRYETEVVAQTPVYVPPPVDTAWIQNSNGSRTPVQLRRAEGGMFIGPRGEYYLGMPTEDQLRRLYGM
jgi:hypothetical protein